MDTASIFFKLNMINYQSIHSDVNLTRTQHLNLVSIWLLLSVSLGSLIWFRYLFLIWFYRTLWDEHISQKATNDVNSKGLPTLIAKRSLKYEMIKDTENLHSFFLSLCKSSQWDVCASGSFLDSQSPRWSGLWVFTLHFPVDLLCWALFTLATPVFSSPRV